MRKCIVRVTGLRNLGSIFFPGTVLRKSAVHAVGKRVPTKTNVRRTVAFTRGQNAMAVRSQGQSVFGHVRRDSDR